MEDKKQQEKQTQEPRSIKVYRGLIVAALVISASIFLISGTLFIREGLTHSWGLGGPADFGSFGSFVGGVLGPAVAASSLLLILKTLKVQMDEMKQTNDSLALSAQLNKYNIEQQRNNFLMSWSIQQLNKQNLTSLKALEYTYIEMVHYINAEPEQQSRARPVLDFIKVQSDKREEIRPSNASEVEEFLKRLAYIATDAINYLNAGGSFHYKKDEIAELLTLLKPFGNEVSSLIESLDKLGLGSYGKPLGVAHQKISSKIEIKTNELLRQLEA